MVNPFIQLLSQSRYSTEWKRIILHTTVTPCYAWHCLSLIRQVSCLVSSLPSKGSQANIHHGFVPHCYGGVKDATVTLQSIHSLTIRSQTWCDGWCVCYSAYAVTLRLRLVLPLSITLYTTVFGHIALTFQPVFCLARVFFDFTANSEWVHYAPWKISSSLWTEYLSVGLAEE